MFPLGAVNMVHSLQWISVMGCHCAGRLATTTITTNEALGRDSQCPTLTLAMHDTDQGRQHAGQPQHSDEDR